MADPDFMKIWTKVSNLWRDKQIGYTWYYNSIGYRTNFWKITEDALDYALEFYNLKQNDNLKSDLLELYKELDTFPEVLGVLKELNLQATHLLFYQMALWKCLIMQLQNLI